MLPSIEVTVTAPISLSAQASRTRDAGLELGESGGHFVPWTSYPFKALSRAVFLGSVKAF